MRNGPLWGLQHRLRQPRLSACCCCCCTASAGRVSVATRRRRLSRAHPSVLHARAGGAQAGAVWRRQSVSRVFDVVRRGGGGGVGRCGHPAPPESRTPVRAPRTSGVARGVSPSVRVRVFDVVRYGRGHRRAAPRLRATCSPKRAVVFFGCTKKSGRIFRVGIFLDFVGLTIRTPPVAYVRRAKRNRIGPHWVKLNGSRHVPAGADPWVADGAADERERASFSVKLVRSSVRFAS